MKIWIAVLAVALVVAGCGYRPVSAAPPSTGAAVRLLPADSPTPTDTPSPADSPTPAAEPSPTPSDTPTPTEAPTGAPTAQPTATPPPAPTPTPTPGGYLFTWSGSGSGTSPEIVWTVPGGYWADLSFSCSGASPSWQMVEWTSEAGDPDGWGVGPLSRTSFSGTQQSAYAPQYTGSGFARWLHIVATTDCSWTVTVRQAS